VTVLDRFRRPTQGFVVGWAWALLVSNCVIVVTGGLVRLTGSGLGCPTWPRCTDESFVPHSALGLHGVIEFGNRLLTYVLIAVAVATWFAVRRWAEAPARAAWLTVLIALGIPAQGVVGGITVLTDLNPWVVSLHFMLSMVLIALSVLLLRLVRGAEPGPVAAVPLWVVRATFVTLWVVVYLGTIVTGSGPHAGDADAPRNDLRPDVWSTVHGYGVAVLVVLTLACLVALRRGPRTALVATACLLAAELAQGVIGYVQYVNDVPVALVTAHMVGATVLMALATWQLVSVRERRAAPVPVA
jgi:cytochrome c oxidase assembly protein subunit 15